MANHEQIAARAYEIWQARGAPHGSHEQDWYQAEQELSGFTVVLSDAGENKIGVIKELRMLTGMDLADARDLAEHTPQTLRSELSLPEAEAIRDRLAAVGAVVEV